MHDKARSLAALAMVIAWLPGCGGGGGSATTPPANLDEILIQIGEKVAARKDGDPPSSPGANEAPRASAEKSFLIGFAGETAVIQLDVEAARLILAFYVKIAGTDFFFEILSDDADTASESSPQASDGQSKFRRKLNSSVTLAFTLPPDIGTDAFDISLSAMDAGGQVSNAVPVRVVVEGPAVAGSENDPRLDELQGNWFQCTPGSDGSTLETLNFNGANLSVSLGDFASNNCTGTTRSNSADSRQVVLGSEFADANGFAATEIDFLAGPPNTRKALLAFNPFFTIYRVQFDRLRFGVAAGTANGSGSDRRPQALSSQRVFRRNLSDATPNQPPRAIAGTDQVVQEGTLVQLDGRASSDPDGTIVSFSWRQVDSNAALSLRNANTAVAEFDAPDVNADVTLTFALDIVDDDGATATSTTTVLIRDFAAENLPPVVSAGSDQSAAPGDRVVLTGTASDTDGELVSVRWNQLSGTEVILDSPDTLSTGFVAPQVSEPTLLSFELTATDNSGQIASDVTRVNVQALVSGGAPRIGGFTTGGPASHVDANIADVGIALVSTDNGLEIHNIEDPRAPVFLSRILEGQKVISTIFRTPSNASVSTENGVSVVDYTDPAAPVVSQSIDLPGQLSGGDSFVGFNSGFLYVAAGDAGFHILGYSANSSLGGNAPLTLLGTVDTGGNALDVRVRNSIDGFNGGDPILVVANGAADVQIYSLAVPIHPTLLSTIETPGSVSTHINSAPDGSGSDFLIADSEAGVHIVEYNGFGAFEIVGSFSAPGGSIVRTFVVVDYLTFACDSLLGVHIVDFATDKTAPTGLATFRPTATCQDYAIPGISDGDSVDPNIGYIAEGASGIGIYELSGLLPPRPE